MTRAPAAQAGLAAWVATLLERTAVVGAGERRCIEILVSWEGQPERGPPRGRDEVRVWDEGFSAWEKRAGAILGAFKRR